MGLKLRVTATVDWDPNPGSYKGVEWPPDSGQKRDLTTPEEIAAFEQHLLDCGDVEFADYVGDEHTVKVEIVND